MNNFKSKTFLEKVKSRLRLLWIVLVLMLIYNITVIEMDLGDDHLTTTLTTNVSTLIYFGGLVYVIIQIVRHKKMLHQKNLHLTQSKKEVDERQQFLHDKSGGIVVDFLLLFLLFVTCATALYDRSTFQIYFIILVITIILKVGSYIVYNKIYK